MYFVDECPMRERAKNQRCLHKTTTEVNTHKYVWNLAWQRISYRKTIEWCTCNATKYPGGRIVKIQIEEHTGWERKTWIRR